MFLFKFGTNFWTQRLKFYTLAQRKDPQKNFCREIRNNFAVRSWSNKIAFYLKKFVLKLGDGLIIHMWWSMNDVTFPPYHFILKYRRPSLSAGLLFADTFLVPKNLLSPAFPLLFAEFWLNWQKKITEKCLYSTPSLFAVSLFTGYLEKVTPSNNKGNL